MTRLRNPKPQSFEEQLDTWRGEHGDTAIDMLLLLELQLADLQDGTQLTCAQLFNDWESWAALNRDAISSMVFSEPRGSLGPALFTVRFDWPKALEACAEGDLIDTDSYATNVNNAFSLVQTALAVDTSLD